MIEINNQINTFLFSWYDFTGDQPSKTLIVSDKNAHIDEDAISGISLIEYADDLFDVRGSGYDYIISLISPEKYKEPNEYITRCLNLLGASGTLLFPMTNRLGIRYFCGDRDPYTNTVFDGTDKYFRTEKETKGRCYSRTEIKEILEKSGVSAYKLYGVFSGKEYPTHLIAEDYIPEEDLANRILPVYHYPPTVFLEEERLYDTLKKEKLLHALANSYLVEVRKGTGELSDALYVTLSIGRDKKNAYATVVKNNNTVIKKALYEEGKDGLKNIIVNHSELAKRDVETVEVSKLAEDDNAVCMPYIKAPTAQKYLQDLLVTDKERFLLEMDSFMAEIDKASIVTENDEITGPIGDKVFWDMIPVNAFKFDGKYIFFDQEFVLQDHSINAIKARVLFTFFAYHDELRFIEEELFNRYGLLEQKEKYRKMEWEFLEKLWSEDVLKTFRDRIRRDTPLSDRNRMYMNCPAGYYETRETDILRGAEYKKCFVFGSGKYAEHFIERHSRFFEISGVVDNDPGKWGTTLLGIEISSPDVLLKEDRDRMRVFVCVKDYTEIVRQLDEMRILDYSIYDKNKVYPRSTALTPFTHKKYHVGYCAGAFDMFHIGHLNLLRRAKQMCDYLVVGVMSDERMYDLKKKYPIIPCDERIKVVEGCRYVDRAECLPADRAGIMDAYNMFHYDCMFSGDDHANDPAWLAERDRLRALGSDIVFVSYTKETSSSAIRAKAGN